MLVAERLARGQLGDVADHIVQAESRSRRTFPRDSAALVAAAHRLALMVRLRPEALDERAVRCPAAPRSPRT